MATFQNSAEGLTNGVALTQGSGGNTGGASGDYFPTITTVGSPTIEGSTAQAAHGTKSIHIVGDNTAQAYIRWTSLGSDRCAGRFYFRLNGSVPSAPGLGDILTIRNPSSGMLTVGINSSNLVQIKDITGATLNTPGWTIPSFSGTQWYRMEFELIAGTTSSNGTIRVRLYLLDATTPISGMDFAANGTANTGTVATLDHIRIGNITTGGVMDWYMDDLALVTASTTQPALPGASSPPVASGGADLYVEAGAATLHLSGTVTVAGATISTAAWTRVSGPDSPAVSTSVSGSGTGNATAAADVDVLPGTYVFRLTGTASNGLTDTDDVTVYAHPAATVSAPVVLVDADDWTSFGGAPNATAAVADTSDTTGIETVDNPAAQLNDFTLPPLGLGPISIKIRGYRTSSAGITRTVRLYKADGTTLLYTATQSPALGVGDLFVTPDGTALAAIPTEASRTALRLRVTSSAA